MTNTTRYRLLNDIPAPFNRVEQVWENTRVQADSGGAQIITPSMLRAQDPVFESAHRAAGETEPAHQAASETEPTHQDQAADGTRFTHRAAGETRDDAQPTGRKMPQAHDDMLTMLLLFVLLSG